MRNIPARFTFIFNRSDKRTKFVNEINEVLLRYINDDFNSGRHGQFADFALEIGIENW